MVVGKLTGLERRIEGLESSGGGDTRIRRELQELKNKVRDLTTEVRDKDAIIDRLESREIISQYEERIEEKQENLVTSVGKVNGGIVALVERIETIEMRDNAWDLNESKIQAVSAELTTRVQALFTNELKSADTSVRRYVGELEYQNRELFKRIERLENEMLSLKASLTSMTERTEVG
ncbi:Hypothetical predicted protein, partial [Paramuricea clavata]